MLAEIRDCDKTRLKILILKIGAFGDVCFALPFISAFEKYYPQAEIDWMVDESYTEFLEGYEGLSKALPIDSSYLYNDSYLRRLKGIQKLRRMTKGYDAIFILHRSPSYVALTAGRKNVFQIVRTSNFMTKNFVRQVKVPVLSTHESLAYKTLFEAWHGASIPDSVWVPPKRKVRVKPVYEKTLALHIGGGDNQRTNFNLKKWPHFNKLIHSFLAEPGYADFKIVLLGTPSERAELGTLPESSRIVDLTGKTKISELPEFVTDLFVGPDSGLLHLYDQADIPCIGLYGPTSDISWGLIGKRSHTVNLKLSCQPCYKDDGNFPACPYNNRCMQELSSDSVLRRIEQILPPRKVEAAAHLFATAK